MEAINRQSIQISKSRKKQWGMIALLCLFFLALAFCLTPDQVSAKTSTKTLKVKNGSNITKDLQSALDSAQKVKGGTIRKIVIPKGTYKISATLKVYSNTHLSMKGVTLKRAGTDFHTMLRLGSPKASHAGYSGFKNITFEGGTWDGNNQFGCAMRLGHAQNIKLLGVTMKKIKNSHHAEIAACKNVTFDKCKFTDFAGSWKSSENYEALQIDIMHKHHFSDYGKFDETPCSNVTVKNCTFSKLQRGMGTHSAIINSCHNQIRIINNTFSDITGYAIIGMNYKNSAINNNTITNCGTGIIFRTMNKAMRAFYVPAKGGKTKALPKLNTQISGNRISVKWKGYPAQAMGISLYGAKLSKGSNGIPAGDYILRGLTVANNNITFTCKGIGLCLEGADQNTVRGNTITGKITVKGANKGSGDGLRLTGSDQNTVENNKILNKVTTGYGQDANGISVLDSSNGNILKSNVITGTSKDGIIARNSKKLTLQSNTISASNRSGISILESSDNSTLSGNKIVGAEEDAIKIRDSLYINVRSNTVNGCGRYGLLVSDSAIVTESLNTFTNCGAGDMRCSGDATLNH